MNGALVSTLIGVKDLRAAKAGESLLQGIDTEVRRERIGETPREDFAGEPVDDGHEVHEAASHRDLSHVRRPDLVRAIDAQTAQQVREDGMLGMRPAGVLPAVNRRDPHAAHQCRDVLAADLPALEPKQVARILAPANGSSRCSSSIRRIVRRSRSEVTTGRQYTLERDRPRSWACRLIGNRRVRSINAFRSTLPVCRARRQKKSISTACWPILACNSFRFGPSCFGGLPEEKISSAPESSWNFYWVISFGCTSKRTASSASGAFEGGQGHLHLERR